MSKIVKMRGTSLLWVNGRDNSICEWQRILKWINTESWYLQKRNPRILSKLFQQLNRFFFLSHPPVSSFLSLTCKYCDKVLQVYGHQWEREPWWPTEVLPWWLRFGQQCVVCSHVVRRGMEFRWRVVLSKNPCSVVTSHLCPSPPEMDSIRCGCVWHPWVLGLIARGRISDRYVTVLQVGWT